MIYKRWLIFSFAFCMVFFVFGQSLSGEANAKVELKKGLTLFSEGSFDKASMIFTKISIDNQAGAMQAEALYWLSMTLLSSNRPEEAQKSIERFLSNFYAHERARDMLYQKGRAIFMQKQYEQAILAFNTYIKTVVDGEYVGSALFWVAESLYNLGRLTDAEAIYRSIIEKYPDNAKNEAAKYKLSLIKFKYREDELLTMLKWSNEESLRTIEEFQRREKAYEQALSVYGKRNVSGEASDAALDSALPTTSTQRLLQLKERTLALLQYLLEKKDNAYGSSK